MKCGRCGRNNPINVSRCLYCGAPINGRPARNQKKQNGNTDRIIIAAIIVLTVILIGTAAFAAYKAMTPSYGSGFRSGGGGGGYTSSSGVYTISFDLNYDGAPEAPQPQQVNGGDYAVVPDNPSRQDYVFAGWYENDSYNSRFDFSTPVSKSHNLIAHWINIADDTDTDGDGLTDAMEEYYGTDITKTDTDGDRLSDYVEVKILYLNPLAVDTDGNGINDGDEDNDKDGLTNLYEVNRGTDPTSSDTDSDGLKDKDEIELYGTDPADEDTDGDGALDGTEVEFNTDPRVANSSFTQSASADPISEFNPVTASVSANVDGDILGTVSIDSVDLTTNPFISPNIAGYIGSAYEFTAAGDIRSAEITFYYDTASFGEPNDNFQPRIYYLNYEKEELEELPNQRVLDGKVTVNTTHFSTYILLNKVEFDEVWNKEIKPPIVDTAGHSSNIDVVYVIDTSSSMNSYDRLPTAVQALTTFINALHDNDRAGLVQFKDYSEILSGLTTDKNTVTEKVSSLHATGSTAMYKGLSDAIDMLTEANEQYGYKMIIILSDGKDEPSTTFADYYESLINTAKENGIVIYTVGAGNNVDMSVLPKIAENTGGKYYTATMTSGITDAFTEIQGSTADLTADTNNDGIPDYYNDLIESGELVLSNGSDEFIGYNFNNDESGKLSDDYDGDGLKNGEELIISKSGNRVYMKMVSNPTLKDSDFDGRDDKSETTSGSNPLKYSYSHYDVGSLMNDDIYAGHQLVNKYDTDFLFALSAALNDTLGFNWNAVKLYKEVYLDYFYDYADAELATMTEQNKKIIVLENTKDSVSLINKIIKNVKAGKKYLLDDTTKELQQLYILRSQLTSIENQINIAGQNINQGDRLEKLATDWVKVTEKINKYGVVSKFSVKVTDFADKYQHFMNRKNLTGLSNKTTINAAAAIFSTGVNIVDTIETYAKVKANNIAYADNLDILAYLSKYGNRIAAKQAATEIFNMLSNNMDEYNKQLSVAIGEDVLNGGAKFAVSALMVKNPYTAALKLGYDILDLLIGTSHKAKCVDTALSLECITTAVANLAKSRLNETQSSYDCIDDSTIVSDRYLTHLAQLRIEGEENFVEYTKNTGWITQFFQNGYNEAREFCNKKVESVREYAKALGLDLSNKASGNQNATGGR